MSSYTSLELLTIWAWISKNLVTRNNSMLLDSDHLVPLLLLHNLLCVLFVRGITNKFGIEVAARAWAA